MKGTVKWFNGKKGYGFVNADGKDYFVHFSSIKAEGYRTLADGEEIEFEVGRNEKGEHAINVTRLNPPKHEKKHREIGNR